MTYQEKSVIASLVTTFVIFSIYFVKISEYCAAGRFETADGLSLLGKMILLLIVGGIVVSIIAHILIAIIYAIVTGGGEIDSSMTDERDKQIELKSVTLSYYVFGAGFILSMIAMATGIQAVPVFNMIIISLACASVFEGLARLYFYRRGF